MVKKVVIEKAKSFLKNCWTGSPRFLPNEFEI